MSNTSDNFLSADAIKAARKTGSGQSKVPVPSLSNGKVGVRATLNNMGISNSLIGYDEGSKTVTLGGKALMRPSYIDEDAGVSYAAPNEIRRSLVDYYSSSSNPIVKVSDAYANYAGQYGLSSDALNYGDGTVTIGGEPLDVLYIDDDGKAWAFRDNVRAATESYIDSIGAETPNDILNYYNNKYLNPINKLVSSVTNRDEFSYDPEDDPVYRAYKKQYMTQGARASENAMANYAALTGGYANSAAATAAAQTSQYYMTQLTNKIPELAQEAYKRYAEKYNTDLELLDSMIDRYNTAYGNAYSANNKTISNANNSASSNIKRDQNAFTKYWEGVFNDQQYTKNDIDNYWSNLESGQNYRWTDMLNEQKSMQNTQNIEGSRLDNIEKEIYLRYYDSLLKSELEGSELDNRLTQERINQLIFGN